MSRVRWVLCLVLCLPLALMALGGYKSLSTGQKDVVKILESDLDISRDDAFRFLKDYMQVYLNGVNWNVYSYNNTSPAGAQFAKSNNKTLFLSVVNNDRIANFSIVKYADSGQLFWQLLETAPTTSKIALERYEEFKEDKEMHLEGESDNYAYFLKEGYLDYTNVFVSDAIGSVQYVSGGKFDLSR